MHSAHARGLLVLQSCPVSRLRSMLVAGCELPRGGESEALGGERGGHAAEVVRVRGLERRDGKDRNGQHGHNV